VILNIEAVSELILGSHYWTFSIESNHQTRHEDPPDRCSAPYLIRLYFKPNQYKNSG